jgi:hypothetical protein
MKWCIRDFGNLSPIPASLMVTIRLEAVLERRTLASQKNQLPDSREPRVAGVPDSCVGYPRFLVTNQDSSSEMC